MERAKLIFDMAIGEVTKRQGTSVWTPSANRRSLRVAARAPRRGLPVKLWSGALKVARKAAATRWEK